METENNLDLYLATVIREGLYSSRRNLGFKMDTLFQGLDVQDKTVLDVGGGNGLISYYLACRGAGQIVCLEPGMAGSRAGIRESFVKLGNLLNCSDKVIQQDDSVQDFAANGKVFDIILLHNSVNHLDEDACINLKNDAKSRIIYQRIFSKLNNLCSDGGKLIICDCSCYNVFALLKKRNPLMPTVEWHKHHPPLTWVELLHETGFVNPEVKWTSLNTLRNPGRLLTGNKVIAYFLTSNFQLIMDKPRRTSPERTLH